PAVSFELNSEGARKFSDVTGANIGRYLAIVLDNRIISAPRIDGRIGAQGQIFGNFTTQSAQDLALVLRSGALPAKLDYLQEQTIGATLGAASIRKGMIASLFGLMSNLFTSIFVSKTLYEMVLSGRQQVQTLSI